MYSIASSPDAHPGEVQLTIAIVRYNHHERDRAGLCTGYLADEVEVGKQIVVGAASGTIIGAAAGAAARNSETAKRTAGVGAAVGTAKGTKHAIKQSNQVLKRCLRGRGYRVLN